MLRCMRLPRYARNDMRGMRLPRRFTPRDDREDARDDRGTMRSPRRYAPRDDRWHARNDMGTMRSPRHKVPRDDIRARNDNVR